MGGGGGGGRSWFGNKQAVQDLERKVKEEIERGSQARRSVFISFDYDDVDEVNLLRAHAKNEYSEIDFIDRSVREEINSDRAEYIKLKITERIRQSSITIIYLTENSATSEWVDWEVRKSLELGKTVVAIHKGDTSPGVMPRVVSEQKIKVIPWTKLAEFLDK